MKTTTLNTSTQSKSLIRTTLVAAIILLVPLVAMQFTDQVAWSLVDFVTGGALLLGAGFTYELIIKKARSSKYRATFAIVLVAVLLLIWLELAVGIFGAPFGGS